MIHLRTLAAALVLPLAASCTEYEFAEQDTTMAFDVEADVIEITIETRGIFGTTIGFGEKDEVIQKRAAARLRRMAEGERYFHFITFPFVFDLDEEGSPVADGPVPEGLEGLEGFEGFEGFAALVEPGRRAIEQISVVEARLFTDENEELGIHQRVRIGEARAAIDLVDALIRESVRHVIVEEKLEVDAGELFASAESRALLAEHVERGARWIELDGESLEIHVPMTAKDLGLVVRESLRSWAADGLDGSSSAAVLFALVHDLDEIDVEGDVVTLRYPFGGDGIIRWQYRGERNEDAAKLRARFADGELGSEGDGGRGGR